MIRRIGSARTSVAILFLLVLGTTAAGQAPRRSAPSTTGWKAPRTAWGDPDLQGVWTNVTEAGTPFERPKEFADRSIDDEGDLAAIVKEQRERAATPEERKRRIEIARGGNAPEHWYEHLDAPEKSQRPWLVIDPPDGSVPALTQQAQAEDARQAQARKAAAGQPPAGPEEMNAWVRCITRGLPGMMMPTWYNNNYHILQAPGFVAISYEMIHEVRIIPLDGRPHLPSKVRQWLGDSRGRWEGDTLVVEVTNFTNGTPFRGSGQNLRLVERFTRTAADTINWSVTVDDGTRWVRPWTFGMPLTKGDAQARLYEYACHEGNSSMENILRGARLSEGTGSR